MSTFTFAKPSLSPLGAAVVALALLTGCSLSLIHISEPTRPY